MDNPNPGEVPAQNAQPTGRVIPSRYIPPPGFEVSFREWNRIKQSVKAIRSSESQWLTGLSAFSSIAIAFLIGAVSLWHLENANSWIFIAFCVIASISFGLACGCGIAYWEKRKQRQRDIDTVIAYMDDIAANYVDESDERQSTP